MQLKTGTYTGDGNATQTIAGVGFQPVVVILYKETSHIYDLARKATPDGTKTDYVQATATWLWYDDDIISLDADGFTVGDGTGAGVNNWNVNLQVYTYIAFGA